MKTAILVFACLLMISCAHDVEKKKIASIPVNPYDSSAMLIEELSDSSFFVPLNTKGDFKIEDIHQLFVTDKKIVVAENSKNSVYIFDRKGEPQVKIHNIGTKEGQFSHVESVIFSEKDTLLEIFDKSLGSLSKYNLDGKYLGTKYIRQNLTIRGYNLFKNGKIYVNQLLYNNYDKRWIGIHEDTKSFVAYVSSTLRIPPVLRQLDRIYNHQIETYNDSLFYFPLLDNKIYSLSINGGEVAYDLALPEKNIPDEKFLNQKPFASYKNLNWKMAYSDFIYNNESLYITDQYIFFRYNFKSEFKTRNLLYSKKSGKVMQFTELNSKYLPNLALLSIVLGKYKNWLIMDVHPTQYGSLPIKTQEEIKAKGSNKVLLFMKIKDF